MAITVDWNIVNTLATSALTLLGLNLWKPWVGAYGGEKGKNLARKEDLDVILSEVRAVTATQKEIESKLTRELWSHQTIWVQKRDLYANLLTIVHTLYDVCVQMQHSAKQFDLSRDEAKKQRYVEEYTAELAQYTDGNRALIRLIGLTRIFGSPLVVDELDKFFTTSIKLPLLPSEEWATAESKRITNSLSTLVGFIKVDLGLVNKTT